MHIPPARQRSRIRKALCHMGRKVATVERPDRDKYGGVLDDRTVIGHVAGYPYHKVRGHMANIVISLPGQIDTDEREGQHLMVLYGCRDATDPFDAYDPPDTRKDDVLVMDGACYRVLSVRDGFGVYQLYQIKEM